MEAAMGARRPMAKRWYRGWSVWRGYMLAVVGIALVTDLVLLNRDRPNAVTVALSYLVVVLASAPSEGGARGCSGDGDGGGGEGRSSGSRCRSGRCRWCVSWRGKGA